MYRLIAVTIWALGTFVVALLAVAGSVSPRDALVFSLLLALFLVGLWYVDWLFREDREPPSRRG